MVLVTVLVLVVTSQQLGRNPAAVSVVPQEGLASSTEARGLQLAASINATQLLVGERLGVSVSLSNLNDSTTTILVSNQWQFHGVPVAVWPVCDTWLPVQVDILDGNYSVQQIPSIANATINYTCEAGIAVRQVAFFPSSEDANITGIGLQSPNQTAGSFHLIFNFTGSGYWNLSLLSKEPNPPILGAQSSIDLVQTPFSPGVYTIAVADEWGQAVILHFVVKT